MLPRPANAEQGAGSREQGAIRSCSMLCARRGGLSLLEMMAATAIMATLTVSIVVVMRSGYAIWNAQEADIDVLENGYGVLRHFARQMRQATAITAITAAGNTTGSLSFTTSAGATCTWARN